MQQVNFTSRRAILKVGVSTMLGLSVVTSLSLGGQNTNGTAKVSGYPYGVDQEEKKIDLKMDMPGGPGSVQMLDVPRLYLLRLPVGSHAGDGSSAAYPPPDVSSLGLQVWLLETNGATISRSQKPFLEDICFPDRNDYWMYYAFNRVPPDELAGIILQVKGKLYCREITRSMIAAAGTPLNALCGRWQSDEGDNYEFVPDGKYKHWQQVPPVTKSAHAAGANASSRIDVSNGRFLIDDDSIVLIEKDGARESNKYRIIQTMFGSKMDLTMPDGSTERYVQR